jgi:N-methylhydantoinase B
MRVDPLTLTIVWNRLVNIAEEMGNTLRKTAYSPGIRDAEDCAFGLFDAGTRMLAEAVYTPGQSGSMPFALRNALNVYPPESLQPGDGLVLNDPYLGNGHLPDVYVFLPIFHEERIIGYAGCCGHHTDVGGAAPGSQAVQGIHDIYQEGMLIPPVMFYKNREPVRDVFELIAGNTRIRDYTIGDLKAQYNACTVGEREFLRLLEEVGTDVWQAGIDELIRRTEEEMREAIQAVPDGEYRFEGFLDDYEEGSDSLRMAVTVKIDGSNLIVDFSGTDGQVQAGINCPYNLTYSYTLYAIKGVLAPSLPSNEGIRRPVTVLAPEGSLLNPLFPAACGARAILVPRLIDTVMGALSIPLPNKAIPASSQFANALIGGRNPRTGRPFVNFQIMSAGFPARPYADGEEGLPLGYNTGNVPIEIDEASDPVIVERLELMPDTAGVGTYRGGVGLRKDIRLLTGPVRASYNSDRHLFPAWGLHGGGSGSTGAIVLNPGPAERRHHSKGIYTLREGDIISIRIGGAGGWGDPMERAPEAVLDDVLDGFISVDSALRDYGVVIRNESVDAQATADARSARRGGRHSHADA